MYSKKKHSAQISPQTPKSPPPQALHPPLPTGLPSPLLPPAVGATAGSPVGSPAGASALCSTPLRLSVPVDFVLSDPISCALRFPWLSTPGPTCHKWFTSSDASRPGSCSVAENEIRPPEYLADRFETR
ncbi:pathogenesis-related thaumatin superfamily protein [Striga asiatica]|uniref:Pathogenesis-related thaumatin superfamily protein n=1 Tax=Striga asiatica TaxID=4170 RepID=A0A5A7P2V9_STRAF|nr:pathogenesis-related thaumatin superfamily protein [Striga asiatica]